MSIDTEDTILSYETKPAMTAFLDVHGTGVTFDHGSASE